jgi:hypothetical protein
LNKHKLTALSAAIGLVMSASAMGAGISEAQYKTAGQSIAARHTADQTACDAMAGNAKDVCTAEANGRESVAKAELELSYGDSSKHRDDVRIAKANAAYAIANEKCDALAGNAQDVCRKEAQSAEVAAKADAERALKAADARTPVPAATTEADQKAATEKRNAAYAVAKEKCDALGEKAQATCIAEAKARHGQS